MADNFMLAVWRQHPHPTAIHPITEGAELTLDDIGTVRLKRDGADRLKLSFVYVNHKHRREIPYTVDALLPIWHRVSTEERPLIGLFANEESVSDERWRQILKELGTALDVEPTADAILDALLDQEIAEMDARWFREHGG